MRNMKKYKNFLIAPLALIALALWSCDTENMGTEYTPDTVGVSFYWTSTSIVYTPDEGSTFSVKVARSTTKGEATVSVTSTDPSGLFTIPSSVTFADGAESADIQITGGDLILGTVYKITLELPEEMLSVTGNRKAEVSFMKDYNWIDTGTGQWTDGLIGTFFGVERLTYPVTVYQAEGEPGMYRVLNPYGFNVYAYTAEAEVTKNPCYLVINANDPNAVSVEPQSLGIDWGYGEFTANSIYPYESENIAAYPLGTMVDKTIDLGAIYVRMGTEYGGIAPEKTILVLPEE